MASMSITSAAPLSGNKRSNPTFWRLLTVLWWPMSAPKAPSTTDEQRLSAELAGLPTYLKRDLGII
jgi:hypothetical protein